MNRRKFHSVGGLLPALLCLLCIGMSEGACGPPPLFHDKTHGHTRASYQGGDTVQYSCFQGYSYRTGSRLSVCRADGTWLPVTLECKLNSCSSPGSPTNGYRDGDYFGVGTRVGYHCNTGYLLQGDHVSTCLADLTWSQSLPTCTVVTCPPLETPPNGQVSVSSTAYGSRAIFTCATGFVYSEDFEYRDCQEDGSWSELDGNCTAIDCGEPWINNGTYILSGGTAYAEAAEFTCNQGTMRFGSKKGTLSRCNRKQLWEPPPPICWGEGGGATWRCPSASLLPSTSSIAAHPYNNKCYQFVHVERYWTQARDYCRRYGGRLLTLPDAATNAFILRNLNNLPWRNRGVWIGLHDRADELVWEWSTESDGFGERVTWTNWGRGHPRASFHHHRDCVRMVRGSGTWRWHETPCALFNWKYRFICQYEMMPSTAAMVATSPSTTPMTSSTKLPTTTTKGTTSTTFRYGVGGEGGPNLLGNEALKESKSSPTTAESFTTEERDVIDVVIPLQLQQNDNDGDTNVLGGVVVACLIMVVLSLLVITVVYFRRRRQKKALSSSLNVTNPSYCSAACGSIVAANGQTTLLKLKATQDNEYTDEPLGKGGKGFIPPYRDDVTMSMEDEYQEVKVADDICTTIVTDQNKANSEAEQKMNNNGNNHVYADPYDVPRKSGPMVQLRPKMPTPGGHYLPMDGGKSQKGASEANPRPVSEVYLTPVSSVESDRQSNIYAEIPGEDDEDTYPLTDNVYETLDDLDKKRHLTP